MKTPEQKYMYDPDYHMLVDLLESFIHRNKYTPSEIREAAMFACIKYEMNQPQRSIAFYDTLSKIRI